MNEHLRKLKKGGKKVGYLRISGGVVTGGCDEWLEKYGDYWCSWSRRQIDFDTDHACVCKDRNGEDVFANDEVDSMGNRCYVLWHQVFLQWCLWHIEGDYYFGSVGTNRDIELIEEKEDE